MYKYTFVISSVKWPCYHYDMETKFKEPEWPPDFTEENSTCIHEAECQIDIRLFLDEYPRWELGTPHRAIILHELVPTHHWQGAERGGMNGPPGPPWQCVWPWFWGRPIYHGVSGIPYIPKGDERHLSECLSVAKGPRPSPLWSSTKKKGDPGHIIFPEEPTT